MHVRDNDPRQPEGPSGKFTIRIDDKQYKKAHEEDNPRSFANGVFAAIVVGVILFLVIALASR